MEVNYLFIIIMLLCFHYNKKGRQKSLSAFYIYTNLDNVRGLATVEGFVLLIDPEFSFIEEIKPFLERLDLQEEPREPVMRFRFAIVGRETYVLASCDDDLPQAQEDFLGFLKQVQARYPEECRPFWQGYETELRERKKERLRQGFVEMGRRRHVGAETGAAGEQGARLAPATTVQRRRGRKRTDPAEINKICADWLKVQDRETQTLFCNRKGISATLLRRWLKHYPYSGS